MVMILFRLVTTLLLVCVVLAGCISPTWAESPEPAVRITPAGIQAKAGDTHQIIVEIRKVTNLGAFQFDLTYDPAVVQVDEVALGDFVRSTGRSVNPLGPRIEAGKVTYGAFSFGDSAGPEGSGPLAVITLTARAGGQTPLGLQNVQVVDVGGVRIPVTTAGATMVVSGTPPSTGVPTATTGGESASSATGTPEIRLPLSPADLAGKVAPPAPSSRDWVIVGGVLVAIVVLATLLARFMAR